MCQRHFQKTAVSLGERHCSVLGEECVSSLFEIVPFRSPCGLSAP